MNLKQIKQTKKILKNLYKFSLIHKKKNKPQRGNSRKKKKQSKKRRKTHKGGGLKEAYEGVFRTLKNLLTKKSDNDDEYSNMSKDYKRLLSM